MGVHKLWAGGDPDDHRQVIQTVEQIVQKRHRLGRGVLHLVEQQHQRRASGIGTQEALDGAKGSWLRALAGLTRLRDRAVGKRDLQQLA